jgi:tRNA pseudouridine38-40 synthase
LPPGSAGQRAASTAQPAVPDAQPAAFVVQPAASVVQPAASTTQPAAAIAPSGQRFALRVAYDGASFPGWQTQPSGAAIQDLLERALSSIAGERIATVCAGRTDAGVHALGQVVHFETRVSRPTSAWVRGVNALLPAEVAAQEVREVDEGFHARYGAVRRAYSYLLYRSPTRHPLYAGRAGWSFRPLDLDRMREAAAALVGEHDFSAFRSSQCQARSPVRRLDRLHIRESGPLVVFELEANAFLHHMVRNLVGALVWIGVGGRPAGGAGYRRAARDRRLAAPTFAPDGLYLAGVEYPARYDIGSWPPASPPLAKA